VTDRHVAVITGGAGGLGQAIARSLGTSGMQIVVADLLVDRADAVAAGLRDDGFDAESMAVDVTDGAAVTAALGGLEAQTGRIDVLVNSAGFPDDKPLLQMDDESWRRVLDVCLFGTFACCRAVAPGMIARGYGRIVNISSRAWLGNPGQANYSAAKAGVVGLTKALAKELGRHGVTVNAVAPGMILTPLVEQHPKYSQIAERAIRDNSIKRLGLPDDVASAVAYLASPEAGFVTGDVLHVSGGRFG
jgi:3-oxoacyl-[acyl-carrier protein] reductase